MPRKYESALRHDQAEQTRDRLLEATAELLTDAGLRELSVAAVAERAGVARRTAYRYFPTLDALIDAFNEWANARFHYPPPFERAEGVADYVAALFGAFARNENLLRAQLESPQARRVRARRKPLQVRYMEARFAKHLGRAFTPEVRARLAAIHALSGAEVYVVLRDYWGLDLESAQQAVRWALTTLVERIAAPAPPRTIAPTHRRP